MKILIGFFLGICVASAVAQINLPAPDAVLTADNFGGRHVGDARAVQVDADGYVICSDKRKP